MTGANADAKQTQPRAPRFDLPTIEDETRAFWDGAKSGQLMIGKCNACGMFHYYPRPFCPSCWSNEVSLVRASGRATLYTYSVIHVNEMPPFKEWLPYIAAAVDLEEGPRLITNVVDCAPDALKIGMPLMVTFREATPEISVPVFRPA